MREELSLSHTKWECKYHVVFIPKSKTGDVVAVFVANEPFTEGVKPGTWLQLLLPRE